MERIDLDPIAGGHGTVAARKRPCGPLAAS